MGFHQSVKRQLRIGFRRKRCALVSVLYRMDSVKPDTFFEKKPPHMRKYVPVPLDLQDTFHTTQHSNVIDTIVVELPGSLHNVMTSTRTGCCNQL